MKNFSIATALGSVIVGFEAREVVVTATAYLATRGPESLSISGLPEAAAREARVRVRSALASDPRTAPATDGLYVAVLVAVVGVPDGISYASLDLAIAVAVLRAAGVPTMLGPLGFEASFVGELTLDGKLRPVRGALVHARRSAPLVVLPAENAWEVGLSSPLGDAYTVARLGDLTDGSIVRDGKVKESTFAPYVQNGFEDLPLRHRAVAEEIRDARRALLVGVPGSGRTMIARRLGTSESLSVEEAREVAKIHGVAGLIGSSSLTLARPFRAPHHTVSEAGLCGDHRRPGEVSLAHRGVLFLDELSDFRRSTIASLATTLDRGRSWPCRGGSGFPAEPRYVVAAAFPCQCGYYCRERPNVGRSCTCSREDRARHDGRLEEIQRMLGLERIEVPKVSLEELRTVPMVKENGARS